MKILLTGASGYIGGNLLESLKEDYEIVAVSRNTDNKEDEKNVTWKEADLYSQIDIENVMDDIDIAIYLVHSMQPSSKLSQAKFEDMDAILADNFAWAAKQKGVKRIIYLSGIIPDDDKLSSHLSSRLECEKILGSYGIPVTTLRAGLIVGPKGSSFPILHNLVKRLPGMLLPSWAYNRTHPVALKDVITGLTRVVRREPDNNEAIDIGGPDEKTYKELFVETAEVMDKKLPMVDVPIIPIFLSKLWVRLIAQKPKEMVYPLLESLTHSMVMRKENYEEGISNAPTTFKESVRIALDSEMDSSSKSGIEIVQKEDVEKNDVKSVQRIRIPKQWSIDDTADYYVNWLSRVGGKFISTKVEEDQTSIALPFFKTPILILDRSEARSYENRILYYIKGGKFSHEREEGRARLEFRRVLDTDEVLIAIHEYEPTLPWFVYTLTQAKIHLIVMKAFGFETRLLANMLDSRYAKYVSNPNES
ncbi:NAD-dependent epimerase/dehydratase family protein [Salinicoccus hispanicus]|uniref:NAD(P)H-binding protein n=1 Tax=Salinicoccus hispanicus TaxID=157225 RepID=A0A6N8U844_9STAP|nr:NAD(P)H-binding protein [Salinicoccus hispanicus]MXQ51819.1 NAD(P)H-binding protein [Salinicoccus hispanicus]